MIGPQPSAPQRPRLRDGGVGMPGPPSQTNQMGLTRGGDDFVGWVVAYLARWFPAGTATGLRWVGKPDARSPVLVTASFSPTVKRVLRALRGRDLWLFVVDTGGINVRCASAGGFHTAQRRVDTVKVCGLSERVRCRELFLPALSAAWIDTTVLRRQAVYSMQDS